MAKSIPLEQVPKTYNTEKMVVVCNPLTEDFNYKYGGVDMVLKSGEMKSLNEALGWFTAKHLAIFILNKRQITFLQQNFPGLNEQGRPKWKMVESAFISKEDIDELKKQFVVTDYKVGDEKPAMPSVNTKFDTKKEEVKATVKDEPKAEAKPEESELDKDEDGDAEPHLVAPIEKTKANKNKKPVGE